MIGGAGGMGSWFRRALEGAGWGVEVVDPAGGGYGAVEEVPDLGRYEYLIVAVPLGAIGEVVGGLRGVRGVVVEVASIQGHLEAVLGRAWERGVRVVALHPMFGPGREVAGGEPLRFVLAAREEPAVEEAAVRRLLAGLPAQVVTLPFERHDELMAWVLGLAHLTSLLFGRALAGCGVDPGELAATSSTTFARQSEVARALFGESPDLYLDIQRLNPHRHEVYAAARAALDEVERLVESGDREGFRALFAAGRAALG